MNQDKMYLINKLFNDKTIRTVWDNENEKYYVSAVDVVGELSNSVEMKISQSERLTRLNNIAR